MCQSWSIYGPWYLYEMVAYIYIGAHVRSNLCYWIWLMHLVRSRAVNSLICFLSRKTYFHHACATPSELPYTRLYTVHMLYTGRKTQTARANKPAFPSWTFCIYLFWFEISWSSKFYCLPLIFLRGAAKRIKVLFLVARPVRPYHPPPLELSGHIFLGDFFSELQKKFFFVSGQALTPPPPLGGRATKKRTFFCGFPNL